jgi:hypothetical protein
MEEENLIFLNFTTFKNNIKKLSIKSKNKKKQKLK